MVAVKRSSEPLPVFPILERKFLLLSLELVVHCFVLILRLAVSPFKTGD